MSDDMGSMATQFGLINSFRTGNTILDMLICMIVPLFFGGIAKVVGDFGPFIRRLSAEYKSRDRVERVVTHVRRINAWGYSAGAQTQDHLLQKALMLYLSEHDPGKHRKATLTLTSGKDRGKRKKDNASDAESGDELQKLDVSTMPPEGLAVDVGGGVRLVRAQHNEEGSGDNGVKTETSTVTLSAMGPQAEDAINAFVEKAFRWYKNNMAEKKDEKR